MRRGRGFKSWGLITVAFILAVLFFGLNIALASSGKDNLLVGFKDSKNLYDAADELGVSQGNLEEIPRINTYEVKDVSFLKRTDINLKAYYKKDIAYVEKNSEVKAFVVPNDSHYSDQWGLPKISAPAGWEVTTGSSSIKIAIIDTGIDGTHPDLSGKVTAGYDYVNHVAITANSDSDDYGHGTAISGVAAAITNNAVGVAGVSWGAQLMPVKVLDHTGTGTIGDLASGIIYSADNSAKVINMSLGASVDSQTVRNAVNYAHDSRNVVLVAASGNDDSAISYPARYANVVAVGATNSNDSRWYGSNHGPELDLVAPGSSVYTTTDGGSYGSLTGTSLATPFVSGAASLVLSINPSATNSRIESDLRNGTDKVSGMGSSNFTNYFGYGRLSLQKIFSDEGVYKADYVGQSSNITALPGDTASLSVIFKNSGSATWYRSSAHPVRLAVDHRDNENFFAAFNNGWSSGYRIMTIPDTVVYPGQTTTFNFNIRVPSGLNPGDYKFKVRLVADGLTWFENPDSNGAAWWKVTLPKPQAALVSQSSYPTLGRGDSTQLSVAFRNDTGITWRSSGNYAVRLALDKFWANSTAWQGSGWLSSNRITSADGDVPAGGTGTFRFNISSPADMSIGNHGF